MRNETKTTGRRLLHPAVKFLASLRIRPTAVTLTALPLSIGAAILFSQGLFTWAGITVFLAGLCDTLDGEISRLTGKTSPIGAFLDSTVDRVSEGIVLIGIAWYYLRFSRFGVITAFLALLFSFLVSYARARAEGIGTICTVGVFERPVRVAILFFSALLLGRSYLPWGLLLIALGSFITFLQRIYWTVKHQRR